MNFQDMVLSGIDLFKYVMEYLPLIYLKYTTAILRTANIPTNWKLPE